MSDPDKCFICGRKMQLYFETWFDINVNKSQDNHIYTQTYRITVKIHLNMESRINFSRRLGTWYIYMYLHRKKRSEQMVLLFTVYFRIGESPRICPQKGPSPIIFQEWTDTRTFSYLKYTSTNVNCILKGIVHFILHTEKKCKSFTWSLLSCPFLRDNGQFYNGNIL